MAGEITASLTAPGLRDYPVPPRSLAIWWLGQSGFLVKSPGGRIVAVDPYLSNSCKALGDRDGLDLDRVAPPPIAARDLVAVDAFAVTHGHQDHLDPETVFAYRAAGGAGPFVAPPDAAAKLAALGVPDDQVWVVWPGRSVEIGDMELKAVFAIPTGGDDVTPVGYVIAARGGPAFYVSGDTGYHEVVGEIVAALRPDVMAVVINGGFGNLTPPEAARLARRIDPRVVIPCHHDLFPDNSQPPRMLRTNLVTLGLGDRFRMLERGRPFLYPEPA